MTDISVYYDASRNVLIELDGAALEISREEAEQLFVDLGHVLKDMDVIDNPMAFDVAE